MIHHRQYRMADDLYTGDYLLVRDFLIRLGNPTYSFGWWDEQITRTSFQLDHLSKFRLWFDGDQMVALACIEVTLGDGILCTQSGYEYLFDDMILYAKENLDDRGSLSLLVPDLNEPYREAAARAGLVASQAGETDCVIQLDAMDLDYALPDGFRIASLRDNYDAFQIERIMRRAFSDDLEAFTLTPDEVAVVDRRFLRPFANLDLHIAVISPDQTYAAFCGLWQTKESAMAFIEPVATDPIYQKKGLGKAVVFEALKRCRDLGASSAVVFSSIPFYTSIGFRPNSTSTYWTAKCTPTCLE